MCSTVRLGQTLKRVGTLLDFFPYSLSMGTYGIEINNQMRIDG